MGALNALYEKYRDRVEFYLVYIREAHPTDGRQVQANVRDGILVEDPKSLEARQKVAGTCAAALGIKFPALVDGLDNAVEQAYAGWPDRLYVVGQDGRIAFKGAPGPSGFRVDDVVRWLSEHLDSPK